MSFLSFMVYFRGGGLYFSSPLVQVTKDRPALTIFYWVELVTRTTVELNQYARRWEHFTCIIYITLSLVKNRFTFQCKTLLCSLVEVGSWGNPSTPSWIPNYLSRQCQLLALAPHWGAAERACAVRGLLGPSRLR